MIKLVIVIVKSRVGEIIGIDRILNAIDEHDLASYQERKFQSTYFRDIPRCLDMIFAGWKA
jgi:hypothetical protein